MLRVEYMLVMGGNVTVSSGVYADKEALVIDCKDEMEVLRCEGIPFTSLILVTEEI